MGRKLRIDMVGVRHGRLVGVAFSHTAPGGRAQWLFACDCGGETVADGGNVRSGSTASCGCLHREISAARLTTHGHRAHKRHDPTYRAWQLMNDACVNPGCSTYRSCGARGIRVAQGWRADFPAFLLAMGQRPAGAVLERIDPAADFSPGNCRWATKRPRRDRAAEGWAQRGVGTAGQRPAARRARSAVATGTGPNRAGAARGIAPATV